MSDQFPPLTRMHRTANWGVWLTSAVLALLLCVIAYFMWTSLSDADALSRLLSDQLGLSGPAPLLNTAQAVTLTVLWLMTDLLALMMLLQARALFAGIRANGAFGGDTARHLRRIGWLVFALGPVSVLVNLCCTVLLNHWRDPTAIHGSLDVSDADLYAMVVGLVLVVLGHIMVDAARIDAENRSFV